MLVLLFICVWRVLFCFFFFKQKTAYEMRISDWSSDVCSSDLSVCPGRVTGSALAEDATAPPSGQVSPDVQGRLIQNPSIVSSLGAEIGRASCRERVCQYV